MSKKDKLIAQEIVEIVEKIKKSRKVIFTGIVKDIDYDNMVCKVQLNENTEGNVTEGVFVNAALEVIDGFVMMPAVDSLVWVAELDGGGNMGVIKISAIDQCFMNVGSDTKLAFNPYYVEIKTVNGLHFLMASGKFKIENGSLNLYTILNNILTHIQALTVPTAMGPSGPPVNIAQFIQDATDLAQLLTA